MTRIPLATTIKTRTGVPAGKDARLVNSYVEVKGEQSVVRKRPIAQGGVAVGTGTAQGGIGFTMGGTDYVYTFNGDTGSLDSLVTAGTSWSSGTSYSIGDHVVIDFVDYWAFADNTNSQPPSSNWSQSYVPAVPFSGTYATWNPLDKGSGVALSNGNLTATASNNHIARSSIGKSSGKWYWEITLDNVGNDTITLLNGAASDLAATNNYLGADAYGWGHTFSNSISGCLPNATIYNSGGGACFGSNVASGNIFGVALNMDSGEITVYINGVSQGVMYSGLSGTVHAAIGADINGPDIDVIGTANFGASAFAYSVPSGYNSGLYT